MLPVEGLSLKNMCPHVGITLWNMPPVGRGGRLLHDDNSEHGSYVGMTLQG